MKDCCITPTAIAKQKARLEIFLKMLHILAHLQSKKIKSLRTSLRATAHEKLLNVIALGQIISLFWIVAYTLLTTSENLS